MRQAGLSKVHLIVNHPRQQPTTCRINFLDVTCCFAKAYNPTVFDKDIAVFRF
jgi:hypothetical protein